LTSALLIGLLLPIRVSGFFPGTLIFLGAMAVLALFVGLLESVMARLRLLHVPQLLVSASALSVLALLLVLR
jgi:formate hydrogenlyase subunit 4